MQHPLRRNRFLSVASLAALVAVVQPPQPVAGQQSANADEDGTVNAAALMKAAPAEWLSYGRDQAETHYSPLDQINAGNVDR